MRKWLVNNTSVYFFSSPGLLEHDFLKKTAREKKMKCTSFPFGMYTEPTAGPRSAAMFVSYPDNNSASHLFSAGLEDIANAPFGQSRHRCRE